MKRVLDVGNCAPDHAAVRHMIEANFAGTKIVQAHGAEDALAALHSERFDLVFVNRKLDQDYSDGLEVIKRLKADPVAKTVPAMLLTNYPEHQATAVAEGAELGFGKLEYDQPETLAKLRRILG